MDNDGWSETLAAAEAAANELDSTTKGYGKLLAGWFVDLAAWKQEHRQHLGERGFRFVLC